MRYALGDAQADVLDSVRRLGPCTTRDLRQDTGRVDASRVVASLVARGRLIAYSDGVFDLPCDADLLSRAKGSITPLKFICRFSRDALGFRGDVCDDIQGCRKVSPDG